MKALIAIMVFLVQLRSCVSYKKTLPVFMIDHDSVMTGLTIKSNPFQTMSSDFFTELALAATSHAEYVLIFIEDSLCTEDISSKDFLGTPFYHLQKGIAANKILYMPSVKEPYELLWHIFEPHVANIFRLGSGEKITIKDQPRYGYVYFKDDHLMTRVEKLRKHDMIIKEVYFRVRQMKSGPVLAFYTGKTNPVSKAWLTAPSPLIRELRDPPKDGMLMVVTSGALFRFSGVYSASATRRSMLADTPVIENELRTRRTLTTTMFVTDVHLQFNFEFEDEYWKLANVALLDAGEEVGRTETDIEAPWQRSYYCSDPIVLINLRDGTSLTISEYQIEPLPRSRRFKDYFQLQLEENDDEDMPVFRAGSPGGSSNGSATEKRMCSFSKAMNCGPYFNAHILSGLLVAALNLGVTFFGVIMIMNCGRNDRFEEPNQSPLIAPELGPGIYVTF